MRQQRARTSSSQRQLGSSMAARETIVSPLAKGKFIMLPWKDKCEQKLEHVHDQEQEQEQYLEHE